MSESIAHASSPAAKCKSRCHLHNSVREQNHADPSVLAPKHEAADNTRSSDSHANQHPALAYRHQPLKRCDGVCGRRRRRVRTRQPAVTLRRLVTKGHAAPAQNHPNAQDEYADRTQLTSLCQETDQAEGDDHQRRNRRGGEEAAELFRQRKRPRRFGHVAIGDYCSSYARRSAYSAGITRSASRIRRLRAQYSITPTAIATTPTAINLAPRPILTITPGPCR